MRGQRAVLTPPVGAVQRTWGSLLARRSQQDRLTTCGRAQRKEGGPLPGTEPTVSQPFVVTAARKELDVNALVPAIRRAAAQAGEHPLGRLPRAVEQRARAVDRERRAIEGRGPAPASSQQ